MRLSIKYRIAVITLVLEAIMIALVLWQTLDHAQQVSRVQLSASEQTIVKLIKQISRASLLTGWSPDLHADFNNLLKNPHIRRITLTDANGQLIVDSRSNKTENKTGADTNSPLSDSKNNEYTWHYQEIRDAGKKMALLGVAFSANTLSANYNASLKQGLIIAIPGMLIIAITGLISGFLLTQRMGKITAAARHFSRGGPQLETDDQGHDELSELAQSFSLIAVATEDKQQQLQESEQYNRMLFEQSPIGLALCKMSGELVDINPAYAEIIGRTIEETLTLSYWNITPEAYAKDEQYQLELLKTTGRYGPYEKEYIHKDGYPVPVRLHGQLLKKSGESYIWSSVEDITEHRQAEDALRRSQKMDAIDQLSGGIAHDFNNQLGVIIGYLDFLQKYTEEDEKPHKWVESATRATLRCIDLTRQLLTFSRRQSREKETVDINDVLQEMQTMIARSVTPEVKVEYFLVGNLWLTEISSGELQDAVLNLVLNARDAMPKGGNLLIETSNKFLDEGYASLNPGVKAGEYIQLMISDTGTGMEADTQDRVFEPFFTTKPEGKGTGLGLAMVYGFVKRYGGGIKIYSRPGSGTTMRLYLPRSKSGEPASIADNNNDNAVLPTGKEHILIVDDEVDLQQLARQYLSELGYQTCIAENATQALQALSDNKDIDLLFSDVVMPGEMNGYELAQQATRKQTELKVLLTSGFTAKTIAGNGQSKFAQHLLSKPYRKSDLAHRIRQVLDEKKAV